MLSLLPILGLAVAGCGGGSATCSGTVTLDGVPLKEGIITFDPYTHGPDAYGQVKDGAFTISTGQKEGLDSGRYRVSISASTIPQMGTKEQAKLLTPKKYASFDTSGLEADVKPGSNTFAFEMSSKP